MSCCNKPLCNNYPRPDFNRGTSEGSDWLDLNGKWDFCFDPEDQFSAETVTFDRTINVPFPWASHAAWGTEAVASSDNFFSRNAYLDPQSVTRDNYRTAPRHTIGWYHRTFAVPTEWREQRVILNFGAVDWEFTVWVNGQRFPHVESGYIPVEIDITDALTEDAGAENEIIVRAYDAQDDDERPMGKQYWWYTTTSGIWQPVWLAPRPANYISQIHVRPDAAHLSADVSIACTLDEGAIHISIADQDGTIAANGEIPCSEGIATGTVSFDGNARLWCPTDPHLYTLTATLKAGDETIDAANTYFGLRDISTAPLYDGGPKYITLNGEPIYLKGCLDQSFNPVGAYTYPSDDAIRYHLQQALDAGFNFIRVHIKIENPRFYYWADKLGILIQYDMPGNGYKIFTERSCALHKRMVEDAIARDFNHPSIFSWVIYNESWGIGLDEYKEAFERHGWVASMQTYAKSLDDSRLVEDNSACMYDHVVTDINSWHYYINDYDMAADHISKIVENTFPGSGFNFCAGHTQTDAPLMNSEYGGIGCMSGDKDVSWCFKFNTNLLRRYPKIAGYVYTELHDIEWEYNGVYNYDGSRKFFGYDFADLQADPYFAFEGAPGEVVEPGATPTIPVFCARQAAPQSPWPEIAVRISGVDSLGNELFNLPTASITWDEDDSPEAAFIRNGKLTFASPLPDCPSLIKLEAFDGDRFTDFKYLEITAGRLPQQETLADGSIVLRKLAGEQEHSSGWHEAEFDRGLVGHQIHLIGGIESGTIDYLFELPEGIDIVDLESVSFIAELSSKMNDARQTEEVQWPTRLHISLNGIELDDRVIADQWADSRGALSHMHALWGRYGELVTVTATDDALTSIAAIDSHNILVRLEVPRSEIPGGLTVYSSRAGKFPVDVTLCLKKRS